MKLLYILFFIFSFIDVSSQTNIKLKKQLDSIMILDQEYRKVLTLIFQDSVLKDSIAQVYEKSFTGIESYIWSKQSQIDSSNLNVIEEIIRKVGYPGISMVGIETSEVAWYVIQHSDKINIYIDLIKEAGKNKELKPNLVAMMTDRFLMDSGKYQIYGTQGTCRKMKDGKRKCFIWPIEDPKKVNKLRRKSGFDLTVEENAKRINIEYEVLTLEQIKQN